MRWIHSMLIPKMIFSIIKSAAMCECWYFALPWTCMFAEIAVVQT